MNNIIKIVIILLLISAPFLYFYLREEPTPPRSENTTPIYNVSSVHLQSEACLNQDFVNLHNQHRIKLGLPAFQCTQLANMSASSRASFLVSTNCWSHKCFEGDDPFKYLLKTPEVKNAGENLSRKYPTVQDSFNALIISETHRKNIENPEFQYIGIGSAYYPNGEKLYVIHFYSLHK